MSKGIELRFEEYDLSMKVMQNKLDASVQDIDSNIKKTMEARLEDLTRDVFRVHHTYFLVDD